LGEQDDGVVGAGGAVGAPDGVDQVLADGLEAGAAALLDALVQLLGDGARDQGGVDADRLAAGGLLGGPLLPCGDVLETRLEEVPVGVQLLPGLVEVAAVGGEGGLVEGDDGGACGAGEARDEGAAGVACGNVLGGMAVFGGDDCGGREGAVSAIEGRRRGS